MNRKLAITIGLQALLIILLFWLLIFYGKDEFEALNIHEDEEIETPQRVDSRDGMTVISVTTATQKQSNIFTSALRPSTHQSNISTYGNVISIDALIELRNRYLASKAEINVIKTTLTHNKHELQRLQTLNLDDKNVSDKVVASALAAVKADESKIAAAETNAKNIADSMKQSWGNILTQDAIQPKTSKLLQALIDNRAVLIQTTLPFDASEPKPGSSIMIAPTAAPSHTLRAYYVSPAPFSNSTMQGKTYFYHATTPELRTGMQVNAITMTTEKKSTGVIIPNSAIIWYAGKPWVYKKTDDDTFTRLAINTDIEVEQGWFYQGALKENDEVVTSGAQLLFSEEFKSQITNENDD